MASRLGISEGSALIVIIEYCEGIISENVDMEEVVDVCSVVLVVVGFSGIGVEDPAPPFP